MEGFTPEAMGSLYSFCKQMAANSIGWGVQTRRTQRRGALGLWNGEGELKPGFEEGRVGPGSGWEQEPGSVAVAQSCFCFTFPQKKGPFL